MLVLSRKKGESVELPTLGVKVLILDLKKSRVQLGIEAPTEIPITRSEQKETGRPSAIPAVTIGFENLAEELLRLEAQIPVLAELSAQENRSLAQDIASELLQRIAAIKESLGLATSERLDAIPISELIVVRTDVLEALRRKQPRQPDEECPSPNSSTSCVHQTTADYTIDRPVAALRQTPEFSVV